jgi:hypothetical protein
MEGGLENKKKIGEKKKTMTKMAGGEGRDVRAVRGGVKPASQGLPRQQTRHLHGRSGARPVDERDGAAVNVVVHGAVRLRRVRDDLVALATARVDDRRVQHVRAEVGDEEDGRARRGRTVLRAARLSAREGPEYRRRLARRVAPGTSTTTTTTTTVRRRIADAPALYVRIEVCGHCECGGWWSRRGCCLWFVCCLGTLRL